MKLFNLIAFDILSLSSLTNCSNNAIDDWNEAVSGINKNYRISLKTEGGFVLKIIFLFPQFLYCFII